MTEKWKHQISPPRSEIIIFFFPSSMASKAPKELSKQERLNLAIDEYNQAFLAYQNSSNPQKKKPALQPIAWRHGVVSSTLSRRITGQTHSHQEAHVDAQRLTSEEESALVSWIQQMAEWGWPPRVVHVRDMATELLVEKGDRKELGVNWVIKFLDRYQELQSRFS